MQHDKKVGLALGILLVSIVGAFFFREESPRGHHAPELRNPEKLDAAIAQGRDKRPYNDAESTPKSRTHEVRRTVPKDDLAPWELPSFMREDGNDTAPPRSRVNASKSPFTADDLPDSPPSKPKVIGEETVAAPKLPVQPDRRATAVPLPAENSDWLPLDPGKRLAAREPSAPATNFSKGRTHVVAAGDTLSSIAEKYLGSQSRFQEIYQANRDQLRSPNDLKIGMKLAIPDRTSGTKSSETSRKVEANSVTSDRSTKATRPTFHSPTTKSNAANTDDSAGDSPRKLQFKPTKSSPTFRRSADGVEQLEPGKTLSQLPPGEFEAIDEGLLAELERDMGTELELPAPPPADQVATEPSPFRVANEESENAGLDD